MSNIKSWADHCSSDEESDDDRIAPPPSNLPGSTSYNQLHAITGEEEASNESESEEEEVLLQFNIPDGPPFTAFLGNLSYDMRNSNDLGQEVDDLLKKRKLEVCDEETGKVLGAVRLSAARLMIERNTGQSRGYGYVEFDTPEELIAFLRMPSPQLCGRTIKVDVASGQQRSGGGDRGGGRGGGDGRRDSTNTRGSRGGRDRDSQGGDVRGGGDIRGSDISRGGRGIPDRDPRGSMGGRGGGGGDVRGSFGDRDSRGSIGDVRGSVGSRGSVGGGGGPPAPIDGSQFMAGRYNRVSSGNLNSGGPGVTPTAVMKRADSTASHGSDLGPRGSASSMGGGGGAPRQRPSLKLAPRTKAVEKAGPSTSQSSIFGGAKPRDETKVLQKKESKDDVTKDVTAGVEKVEIKEKKEDKPKKPIVDVSKEADKVSNGAKATPDAPIKEDNSSAAAAKDKEGTAKEDAKEPNEATKKPNLDRKDSRGGRGGRGGKRDNVEGGGRGAKRENSDRKRDGRRDSTRKSGRGGRGGGRRENSDRGTGGGGRGEGRNSDNKRNSKSNRNGNDNKGKDKDKDKDNTGKDSAGANDAKGSTNSLAAAAATPAEGAKGQPQQQPASKTPPTMPVKETKKKPNSFAAFMDESDDE